MDHDFGQPPNGAFPYTMKTTQVLEHSRGIAWTADLLCDGTKIGVIEQEGNGGADYVLIGDPANAAIWRSNVERAFNGQEEHATYWLLTEEENQ